jgi:hypothetical protein
MASIRLAKQAAVKELGKYVEDVAGALGKREALVTDETLVSDLLEIGENPHRVKRGEAGMWQERPGNPEAKKRNDEQIGQAIHALGIPIEREDAVVAVAKRLRDFARGGKS